MKRLAIVAAVLVVTACKAKDENVADTSAAMSPAPMDSSMMMGDSMKMHDSMMMKDSMMKKP